MQTSIRLTSCAALLTAFWGVVPARAEVPTVANPARFSDTPVEYNLAPPVLGQHTSEVLKEVLGCSDDEIGNLYDAGAI